MAIPIPPYVPSFKPVPQVTPFTYRDGVTMLKKLDDMVRYLNRVIVPFVNTDLSELGEQVESDINDMISQVNAAIDEVLNSSVDVQDTVVAGIFNNPASATRHVTDALYAAKSVVDGISDLINTGRLSQATLDATYAKKRWFDVKTYGAKGDGTTDDTTAILNAINDAQTSRGTVYFPAGIYIVSQTLTVYSNVWWLGEGPGASEIRLAINANVDLVKTNGYNALAGGTSQNGPDRWGLEKLRLNGNGSAQTATSWVMKTYGRAFTVLNCEIMNGRDGNWHSEWGTGGVDMESKIVDVNISGAINGPGLDWQGPHDSSFANVFIYKNGEASQAWDGLTTSGNAGGEIFVNVHVWGSHNNGINVRKMATLTGCVSEGAKTANVIIASNRTMFDGHIYGRSDGSSATEVGLQIGDSTSGAITGYHINAVLFNFANAASVPIKLVSDSGGAIFATVNRGSATVSISGTQNARTQAVITTVDADAGLAYFTATKLDHPSAPLTVNVGGASRFRVNGNVAQFANGIGLRGYSDELATEKWRIDSSLGYFKVASYTTATLPSATTVGQGAMVYNTTDSSICVSNGTTWTRADGTAV